MSGNDHPSSFGCRGCWLSVPAATGLLVFPAAASSRPAHVTTITAQSARHVAAAPGSDRRAPVPGGGPRPREPGPFGAAGVHPGDPLASAAHPSVSANR